MCDTRVYSDGQVGPNTYVVPVRTVTTAGIQMWIRMLYVMECVLHVFQRGAVEKVLPNNLEAAGLYAPMRIGAIC